MKIAVTSQNRKTITGHAGKCRKFWIYETEGSRIVDKTLLEIALEQSFHESHGIGPHPLDGVNVLIAGGAGDGLLRRLDRMGIRALMTPETDPDAAVSALLDGTLQLGYPAGHEEHDKHHHGHNGERGHRHQTVVSFPQINKE